MNPHTPTAIDSIRRLHAHRRWVNERLRDAARGLDAGARSREFDIGQRSLLATLTHLYVAERVWLEAIEGGEPPPPSAFAFDALDRLETAWDELEARWASRLDRLEGDDLDRIVVKRSTHSDRVQQTTLHDVLLHVCTHAQYTAAQAANILRRLGKTPPDTMLITMSRVEHDRD